MKNKTILQRIWLGVKVGWKTPTLPDNILKFTMHPLIRILRVLGGISTILILTKRLSFLGEGSLYIASLSICTLLTIMFGFYHIFITYHRIKHMIKIFKSGELDIRNSPLDRFASIAAKLISCSKGFCDTAAPIGVIFGGMAGIDELRKAKGLEPIFLPTLANLILPDNDLQKRVKQMRYDEAALERNFKEGNLYKEEHSIVNSFEENGIITQEEAKKWRNQLSKNETICNLESKNIKSKILDSLEKLNQSRRK